jgi:hypothetical protein
MDPTHEKEEEEEAEEDFPMLSHYDLSDGSTI